MISNRAEALAWLDKAGLVVDVKIYGSAKYPKPLDFDAAYAAFVEALRRQVEPL